ncbi:MULTISPECIES: amidohydrolase [Asticcacaulis]|uniref:amidohydrolase family protein n=1 Tax=Asticcacaulis TaxID=76890 RepID=UPI001AE58E92|nr:MULTISPECIES: amidohydrolase family protein [Asticcacaulis]MBP2159445.1 L-fuconolactonase [Asticcacaulis solisilvae]MDR6800728.1 L-fuconolactonase [Asticcacaulis sp. BE141]
MVIDSHQHLWQIGRNGHEWPTPDLTAIHRDFGPEDLRAEAVAVDGSVLVQSQPNDADTDWMLDVAATEPFIKGVVGWADLEAPSAPARLAELARRPKLKGIRPMLQGLADDEWILRGTVRPALTALTDLNLRLDALIFPRHLGVIDRLAQTYPSLAIVIDHCGKPQIGPQIGNGNDALWRDGIARAAGNPNVFCKLSGLATEMADGLSLDAAKPYADHVLACFGADRLMWGSDWPVVNLRAHYDVWQDWTSAWLAPQSEAVRDAVFGGTARRFYQLT